MEEETVRTRDTKVAQQVQGQFSRIDESPSMAAQDAYCGATRLKSTSGLKGGGFDQGAETLVIGNGEVLNKSIVPGNNMIRATILGSLNWGQRAKGTG